MPWGVALEGVGVNEISKERSVMDVSKLDPHEDLFMRKAIEIVVELSVILRKIDIELCLEQHLTCVDVIEP